jgi:hypothetical protein
MYFFMQGDYTLGGRWGRHISLTDPDQFFGTDLSKQTVKVYGHFLPRPKVGQTLVGEFQKSFIKFMFVKVEYCNDPHDMFFADVRAIAQELK